MEEVSKRYCDKADECLFIREYWLTDSVFQVQNTTSVLTVPNNPASVVVESVFGWIIFRQRTDLIFNRTLTWASYKTGFGTIGSSAFWQGLDTVSALTNGAPYKLRVELRNANGQWYSAEYGAFQMSGEATFYTLPVSQYSGDAGDSLLYTDRVVEHRTEQRYEFTTIDQDHDEAFAGNCAKVACGGSVRYEGWWYNDCHHACTTCIPAKYGWNSLMVPSLQTVRLLMKSF